MSAAPPQTAATTSAPRAPTGSATAAGRLASGARWLTLSTLTVGAVNYGYALLLTRLLSVEGYAVYAAGQALLLTAGTVAAVSVPWVLAEHLGKAGADRERRRQAVRFASVVNLAQGIVVGAVVGLLSAAFAGWVASTVVAASAALMFLASTSLGWLQGAQRFAAVAGRGVAEVVTKFCCGLGLVALGAGATGALAGFGAGALVLLVAGTWLMRADHAPVLGAMRGREMWASARGVGAVQGLVSVLACLDVVLVAMLPLPASAAASYQASMILARIPLFLAGAVAAVAFPMLGAATSPAPLLAAGTRLYLVVSVPVALAVATIPPPLLAAVFPHSYDQVGQVLPLTAAAGLLIGVVELLTTFFQAAGAYRPCVRRQALGVAATAALVPVGYSAGGLTGVALAACTGAGLTVGLLVRAGARTWPTAFWLPPSGVLGAVLLGLALLVLRAHPAAWLCLTAVATAGCAYSAFLRPGRDLEHAV